jgi:hypothetical protein
MYNMKERTNDLMKKIIEADFKTDYKEKQYPGIQFRIWSKKPFEDFVQFWPEIEKCFQRPHGHNFYFKHPEFFGYQEENTFPFTYDTSWGTMKKGKIVLTACIIPNKFRIKPHHFDFSSDLTYDEYFENKPYIDEIKRIMGSNEMRINNYRKIINDYRDETHFWIERKFIDAIKSNKGTKFLFALLNLEKETRYWGIGFGLRPYLITKENVEYFKNKEQEDFREKAYETADKFELNRQDFYKSGRELLQKYPADNR